MKGTRHIAFVFLIICMLVFTGLPAGTVYAFSEDPDQETVVSSDNQSDLSETIQPSETTAPSVTPESTETPENTVAPDPSEVPEASVTPEPTETPEVTVTPDPSETPEVTVTPDPSETPEATITPDPSETPIPTESPARLPLKEMTLQYDALSYNGKTRTQSGTTCVTADVDGEEVRLMEGTDYILTYSENRTDVGTVTLTATGIGEYEGTLTATYEITPIPIRQAFLEADTLFYMGVPKTQNKTVVRAWQQGAWKELTLNQDYTITYENNVNIGKATMIIQGIGNYNGELVKTFNIIPRKTYIMSLENDAGSNRVTVNWAKQSDCTTGYQIQYATDKSFIKGANITIARSPYQLSKVVANLTPGLPWYFRIRTYRTTAGTNFYSDWSAKKSITLKPNVLAITGSGSNRTISIENPYSTYTKMKVAVWSKEGDQDDLKWYDMVKQSDGSFKVTVSILNLMHPGTCYAHVYANDTKFVDGKSFTFTKAEFAATENTLSVSGSSATRTVTLYHPASGVQNPEIAVWSKEGGQDDLKWYSMTKQSNGSYSVNISTTRLAHSGLVYIHCYSAGRKQFIKAATFTSTLTTGTITWDPSWEFASYSQIHSGSPKIYRATSNRKGIIVGINPGHGTVNGSYYYVYSHPDGSPKITGGSTAAGAVYTPADNEGMTFADGVPEASVSLRQAEILRDILLDAGYDVIMLRENNDSGLDVVGRTVVCNENANCHISLHWDGDGLPYDKGIFYMSVPDGLKGMYPTSTIWSESNRLGDCLIQGLRSQGRSIFESGSMQIDLMQTSYSKIPSIDIELGNQSSNHSDSVLTANAYGILNGLNKYYG